MAVTVSPVADRTENGCMYHIQRRDVVFTSQAGFASCASASGVLPATTPEQVFDALTRDDVPPAMRFVQERTKYKLVHAETDDSLRMYEAEYKTNCRVAGGYQWQGTMPFHITHDRAANTVTMRLAKAGFLQRLEVTFNVTSSEDGGAALTVSQKIKPALPAWDPVSKHIVKAINRGLLLDTLNDTLSHVEKCKCLPPPPPRTLMLRTSSWTNGLQDITANLQSNFLGLGKQLSISSFPIAFNDLADDGAH